MAKRIFGIGVAILVTTTSCIALNLLYKIFAPEVKFEFSQNELVQRMEPRDTTTNRLVIPKIGFNADLGLASESLNTGGWVQMTDIQTDLPEVIAVHRYGIEGLTAEEQIHTTLFLADKLQMGDELQVIWQKQEYKYHIKAIQSETNNPEVGKDDLLIYTCLFFNNSNRIFITAETIN